MDIHPKTLMLNPDRYNSFDINHLSQLHVRINQPSKNLLNIDEWIELTNIPYALNRENNIPAKISVTTSCKKEKNVNETIISSSQLIDSIKMQKPSNLSSVLISVNITNQFNEITPKNTKKFISGSELFSQLYLDEKSSGDSTNNTIKYEEKDSTYRIVRSVSGSHVEITDKLIDGTATVKIYGNNKYDYYLIQSEYQLRIFTEKNNHCTKVEIVEGKSFKLFEQSNLIVEIVQ
jgi:hypothetical protein